MGVLTITSIEDRPAIVLRLKLDSEPRLETEKRSIFRKGVEKRQL
jgi:hypothetical protein